jgi:hypothetical protein
MKTHLKRSLFVLVAATLISVSAKAQPGSRRNSVIDSLNITDPDEKKVLALYDDAITDYLTEWKSLAADPKKFNETYRKDIDAKYKQRAKDIQPSIDNLRKKFQGNYAEAMKFAQFSQYESQRLMIIYSKYQQQFMKAYGAAGH